MIDIFDYVFLRVYDFFADKNDIIPETRGALILSLLQFLVVLDIILIIKLFHPISLTAYVLSFVAGVPLIIFNRYHYEKIDIQKVRHKWENESPRRRALNHWMMGACVAVLFIPVIISIAG